jgi:hypothetical protein
MKELLISILLLAALNSCSNDYFKYNPLNDGYRLEQNKKRMEIEYKITKARGNGVHGKRARIFLYMEDGFYEYMGYDKPTKLNFVNKYKRYYRNKINEMIFHDAISTEIIKENLSLDNFIQSYLIEINDEKGKYYRIKDYVRKREILFGRSMYDDDTIDAIALAAQYCYDFLIVLVNDSFFHDFRLYLPDEYCVGLTTW